MIKWRRFYSLKTWAMKMFKSFFIVWRGTHPWFFFSPIMAMAKMAPKWGLARKPLVQNSIPPGKQWNRSWFFDDFPLRKTIEKVRSSFSAVWAARIAIQVSPFTARRTVCGSSEKMQPREDVRGKNENAEFCSRLPTKCGDGFRGFQSFCKVQTFFGLRPPIFRSLKRRAFRGICTPDCF